MFSLEIVINVLDDAHRFFDTHTKRDRERVEWEQ